ncbi:MAG: nucleotidyltransferase domain-containing protein [Candidatus Woesearchaeota archaeon]
MSNFWNDWKRKTKLEESAIKSIKTGRKILLNEIPKEQIVAIYAKGSFVRREMNKKSDVDTVTILKESKYLKNLQQLEGKYGDRYKPQIQFSGYSLWELKRNKKTKHGNKLRASPSRTVQHLDHYKLLYGEKLDKSDFHQGSREGHLRGMLHAFKEIFLPGYEKNKFGFSDLVKQVFWLVENEQIWKGKNPPHHWGRLAKSIKDENHIIHDALRYRLKPIKDKNERAKFIRKLKKYISELEKLAHTKH